MASSSRAGDSPSAPLARSLDREGFIVRPSDSSRIFGRPRLRSPLAAPSILKDRALGEASMRILAVDDDEDYLEILRFHFGRAGIDVVTCTSGHVALRLLEQQRFDVAMVDLMMPSMDGNVLCKHIRGKSHHADLPIVMMTHMGNVPFIRASSPGLTSHFVNKEGEPDWLIQLVRDLSGRRTARRQV